MVCEKVHPTDSHKTFSSLWTLVFKWLRPADFCQFECIHITSNAPRSARCLQRHLRWNRCYLFTLKLARSCHIHTLMSTRMMEGGRGLSRCTRIRRTRRASRRLIKLTPPSSLAFSAFLHFSFRHCLARETSSSSYGLAYWSYPSLFPVILSHTRHAQTDAVLRDLRYTLLSSCH